ncbi:MAG: D-alanyl-D-alanine carboxypeptidase/D-alanyl-D-alanine-endopeptidase [Acidimicrobiia bacterium]|nr:D-alanyl-D-alanine carboxypeptidase/D-alanyl-D-alanine-endopeptidase [Acidimicrobiia bacterium]
MPRPLYRRTPLWELENVGSPRSRAERPGWRDAASSKGRRRWAPRTVLVLASAILLVSGPGGWSLPAQPATSLAEEIEQLIRQPQWETVWWGVHIVSLKDGSVLFSSNAHKGFVPASNMKLLVGAAALDAFGATFRFETPVYGEGIVDKQGRLLGDLVLSGCGDPNLEGRLYEAEQEDLKQQDIPRVMVQIAAQLAERGLKSVVGDLVADETLFLHEPHDSSWTMENVLWSYGAPVSSLAAAENWFQLEVLPGEAEGSAALVRPTPVEAGFVLVNQVKTIGRLREAWMGIDRPYGADRVMLRGEIPLEHAGLSYNLAVRDAGIFAAQLLKSALAQRGISVMGSVRARQLSALDAMEEGKFSLDAARRLQTVYRTERRLASVKTQPLPESLKIMMKTSQNLYAEMMLRNLGVAATGLGSAETGAAVLRKFLEKAGAPAHGMSLNDGSGLSRKNLVTPESVVRVLQYMDRHPHREVFADLLPVAGRDGTLKHRMKKGPAFGRISAKTGAVEFVNALSGYAISGSGERLAFSIMVNNATGASREVREAIDKVCEWMTR